MVSGRNEHETIGPRVASAREDLGRTQAELAGQLGLDRTAIAKIESGRRRVSATELVGLAAALDRPIDWFVDESPPAVVSRRQDPSAGGRSALLDRRIDRLARDVTFLATDGVLPPIDVPEFDVPETVAEAEEAATLVRSRIGAGSGPLLDLQRHSEVLGLLAFSLDLGEEGRDGAYVAVDGWGAALINGAVDPGRRRFNLAHELGHHLFADAYAPEVTISPGNDTEKLINAFAIHLLLPRSGVEAVWRNFDDQRLAAVAVSVRYRVSWTAACSHLKNLGLVDDAGRAGLVSAPPTGADFVALGERWVSELDPPAVPPEYGRRVLAAYRTGRLSSDRTSELLWGTVRKEELPERQAVPLPGLRREFDPLQ